MRSPLYRRARELPHLRIEGVDCHIGSQLTEVAPFVAALERVLALVDALARDGIAIAAYRSRRRAGHPLSG